MSTFVTADAVGVHVRTLQRWAAAHWVQPVNTLPSGRHQWLVDHLWVQLDRVGLMPREG